MSPRESPVEQGGFYPPLRRIPSASSAGGAPQPARWHLLRHQKRLLTCRRLRSRCCIHATDRFRPGNTFLRDSAPDAPDEGIWTAPLRPPPVRRARHPGMMDQSMAALRSAPRLDNGNIYNVLIILSVVRLCNVGSSTQGKTFSIFNLINTVHHVPSFKSDA